jgi:two-component SAPR family response regulator
VYWSGFYRISPDIELSYDAMLFKELVQRAAVPNEADTQDLLQRATLLYRSHFITSLDSEWVKSRRQELLQMYGETLIALGKQCENVGDKKQALGYYLRAAKTNRLREDVAGMIMSIYSALGSRDDALATYDRLERELKTALGVAPAPNIQQLAQQIRAQ